MSSIVHPKEAEDNKSSGGKGLRDKSKWKQGNELPEVVGTSNEWIAVEARDHPGVIVVTLAEALQMHVAEEVHDFGQNENWGQDVVNELHAKKRVIWDPRLPKCLRSVEWMKQVKGDQDAKEQPIEAHLSYDLVKWLSWFAVIMNEYAFNESFDKMSESHLKGYVLAQSRFPFFIQNFFFVKVFITCKTVFIDFISI